MHGEVNDGSRVGPTFFVTDKMPERRGRKRSKLYQLFLRQESSCSAGRKSFFSQDLKNFLWKVVHGTRGGGERRKEKGEI